MTNLPCERPSRRECAGLCPGTIGTSTSRIALISPPSSVFLCQLAAMASCGKVNEAFNEVVARRNAFGCGCHLVSESILSYSSGAYSRGVSSALVTGLTAVAASTCSHWKGARISERVKAMRTPESIFPRSYEDHTRDTSC